MLDKLVLFMLSLRAKLSSERGQDIVEYVVLVGGVGVALVAALVFFDLDTLFGDLSDWMIGLVP